MAIVKDVAGSSYESSRDGRGKTFIDGLATDIRDIGYIPGVHLNV